MLLMAPNERVVWPQVWLPVQAVYLASQPVSLLADVEADFGATDGAE